MIRASRCWCGPGAGAFPVAAPRLSVIYYNFFFLFFRERVEAPPGSAAAALGQYVAMRTGRTRAEERAILQVGRSRTLTNVSKTRHSDGVLDYKLKTSERRWVPESVLGPEASLHGTMTKERRGEVDQQRAHMGEPANGE
ncbi:hypothetical protein NDU88_006447 [Pleurodeles waltl]|uniref:Uncharacterized protein n=1 Tax=Pleurodeles waltl TaxID=8319 RepID=A0AAV7RLM5_PLEWA|nr:hypothetical protein NDU88_006447 [Pleurodeles waltl]